MTEHGKAISVLTMNTIAFTVCFAVWMMNGVLITFLADNRVYDWDKVEMGWLIGIPVLTGALFRLPVGILTDKYGGRIVFLVVMLVTAVASYAASFAHDFWSFALAGLGFGFAGTGFAVGIAYTSLFFPKHQQGTALGIFGAGNAGAAITSMGAPPLLAWLTDNGDNMEGWRELPRIYALSMVVMSIFFWMFTHYKIAEASQGKTLVQRLEPLKHMRVWRFGLYYFLVFGGFVALAQWLIPYYVNVYATSVATAGLLAAVFTLPSGLIRALGGWISDKIGARTVMYWVLGGCAICSLMLIMPRMDIYAPGQGVMAVRSGEVTMVTDHTMVVDDVSYDLTPAPPRQDFDDGRNLIMPTGAFWQEAVVKPGDTVKRKQLIARGITHVYFQANIWIFTAIVFVIGILMGIGKAAVYKHIPDYFPDDVGVTGGIVGVLGGLGGFFCPIFFGSVLKVSGIWTTCWMFFFALSMWCLIWMHTVIRRMLKARAPHYADRVEDHDGALPATATPS